MTARYRVELEARARLDDEALSRLVERLGADERVQVASLGYASAKAPLRVSLIVSGTAGQARDGAAGALAEALLAVGAGAACEIVAVDPESPPASGPPFLVLVLAGRHEEPRAADRLLDELLADARVGEASVSGGGEVTALLALDESRPAVEGLALEAVAGALERAGLDVSAARVASVSGPDGSPA